VNRRFVYAIPSEAGLNSNLPMLVFMPHPAHGQVPAGRAGQQVERKRFLMPGVFLSTVIILM
jgi:hypothetical protein